MREAAAIQLVCGTKASWLCHRHIELMPIAFRQLMQAVRIYAIGSRVSMASLLHQPESDTAYQY